MLRTPSKAQPTLAAVCQIVKHDHASVSLRNSMRANYRRRSTSRLRSTMLQGDCVKANTALVFNCITFSNISGLYFPELEQSAFLRKRLHSNHGHSPSFPGVH